MKTEVFTQNAHLFLGLTRKELSRRISLGQINFEILKSQIEQNSRETELETICERYLTDKSVDQVDKYDFISEPGVVMTPW